LRVRPDELLFAFRARATVRVLFDLAGRAFVFFAERALGLARPDFFAPARLDLAGRVDF
jgi:hypothetical protein